MYRRAEPKAGLWPGIAVEFGITAIGGGGSLHAEQGCRSHLTAGHTVNGIVDKDDSDILATVAGMYSLCRTDSRQVTVALISEYQSTGIEAVGSGGQSGRTAMGSLDPVDIDIVISKTAQPTGAIPMARSATPISSRIWAMSL